MRAVRILRSWFRERSIRQKINIIYIILIICQLLVLTYVTNYISTRAMIRNTIKQSEVNSRLVTNNIENILDNTESYVNDITIRINNYFVDDYRTNGNIYNTNVMLKKIFRNTLYVYPRIYSIAFIMNDGNCILSDNISSDADVYSYVSIYRNTPESSMHGISWLGVRKNNISRELSSPYILTLGKEIVNIDTGEKLGTLLVFIKENTFSDIYGSMRMGRTGRYFICDEKGYVVSSLNKEDMMKPVKDKGLNRWILVHKSESEVVNFSEKRMLVTSYSFPKLKWQLVGAVPLNEVTEDSQRIGMLIIAVGILSMLTSVLLSSKLSATITKPIDRLTKEVRELQLYNLDVETEVNYFDDVGLLTHNFNKMKQRIGELMTRIIKEQEKQKKYELKLLQAQIRPHFLYNTLQLIYSLIEMDKKEQAQKAAKSLADYYRIALSSGNEIISIEQELKNLEGYLYIQNIRHAEMFGYSINIPDDLKKYKILKLSLQPIVENSIKHGFPGKYNEEKGIIDITAEKAEESLTFKIWDNGVGIKPERVQKIFMQEDETSKESFGLKNIDERIKLFYGCDYGIKIKSEYGKYTEVKVVIPALEDINDDIL